MPIYGRQFSNQGLRVTVNALINNPKVLPERMLRMLDQQFLMEAILRDDGPNDSGVIEFTIDAPQFLDDEPELIAEGAEIPVLTGSDGTPRAAYTIKTGYGLEITREMKTRNKTSTINRRMVQGRNTMLRSWERRMFAAFDAGAATVQPVGTAWTSSTAIRDDLALAIETINEARSGIGGSTGNQDYLGFVADTLVIPMGAKYDLMKNDAFARLYELGENVDKHPMYRFQLERSIMSLTVMESRFLADGTAYVMQRGEVGGYSDEYPLQADPLYEDQNRQTWRTNVTRRTAIYIDQPKAYVKLTGI
jgi:hypothetical protein